MKIEINMVAAALKQAQVDPAKLREVIELLNAEVEAQEANAEESPPAVKKQFVIIVSDPNGIVPANDFVGWVVQIPESDSPATALQRVRETALDFNVTKKGRMLPVQTVGETMESVSTKLLKERGVWVKTKTPVLVLRTDNKLPKE